MDISVVNYKDYKKFLREYISGTKPQRGIISRLAQAANCQPSYLSQVLNSHVHLTPDQALAMGEFLNLSSLELDFFLLLVDHARSGSSKLKKRLESKIEEIKSKNEDLSQRLSRPKVELTENQAVYYSSWLWAALHVLVDIPQFQSTTAIAKKMRIEESAALSCLERLEQMGFIKREQGHWKHSGVEIHLPKESPLISMHHNNWRQLGVLKSQQHIESDLHFTGVYAIGAADFEKIKELILKNLMQVTKMAGTSPSEKLVCINHDFFEV
jgi:uncharacterized protein (TIGR02147 family)